MNAQTKIEPPTLAKLREPFAPNQISKLPKPTTKDGRKGKCAECGGYHMLPAVHLDYVGHAALTDRLLDTDPEWNWEPLATTPEGLPQFDQNGGLWIKLTVLGMTRLGYGSADGKRGGDAIKEIIGDALRNAAMRFGAALDLWHKGDLHGDADEDETTKSQSRPVDNRREEPHDDRINETQLTKIQILLKATKIDETTFLRGMGAPDGARIFQLPQSMFSEAVERLEAKLAQMAKQESNARGNQSSAGEFADLSEDEIPF